MADESVFVVRRVSVVLVVLGALLAPGLARAGDVAIHVQAIPLGPRSLASVAKPMHFNMLAAQWRGGGAVDYRVHRLHGGWSGWRAASSDDPDWTGGSDLLQFRARGRVGRLRAYELWSRVTAKPRRSLATAAEPAIVTRAQWGANEKIVRARPLIAKSLRLAIVHHTAGSNRYSPAQSAAIVRGIELYHVEGNGWNDIGYNFLVDRYGTVYEGRGGGMTRNVIGAHSAGFNAGTVGISLIGNYASAVPTKAQQDALVKLLAWRLDIAHVDPLSTVAYTSGGNAKFRAGKVVTLHAISAHRDVYFTECPGIGAYRLLPSIARRVALTGLPKIYGPSVAGTLGGPIRFQARLSSAVTWTVTVTDSAGHAVGHGTGTGPLVDWTWHSPAHKAAYGWAIAAPGALAASGTIGGSAKPPPPPPPSASITNLAASPSTITPASDGTGATTLVTFDLSAAARVTAELLDVNGALVTQPLDEDRPGGQGSFTLDASTLPDGRYTLVVTAAKGPPATLPLVVDRTISGIAFAPSPFSPNGDGVDDTAALTFTLAQAVPVHIEVDHDGATVAQLFDGTLGAGPHTLAWDGTDGSGNVLQPGTYVVVLTITDALGPVTIPLQVTLAP